MLAGKTLPHPPHPCVAEYFRWKQGLPLWHTPSSWGVTFAYAVEYLLRGWGKSGKKRLPAGKAIPNSPAVEPTVPTDGTEATQSAQNCAESETPANPSEAEENGYEEDEVDLSAFFPSSHHAGVVAQLEQLRRSEYGHDEWGEAVPQE